MDLSVIIYLIIIVWVLAELKKRGILDNLFKKGFGMYGSSTSSKPAVTTGDIEEHEKQIKRIQFIDEFLKGNYTPKYVKDELKIRNSEFVDLVFQRIQKGGVKVE